MVDKEIYNKCVQKAEGVLVFGGWCLKNYVGDIKKLSQLLLTKVSHELEIWICGSQDECPRPLSYDDKRPIRSIHFHKLNILTISMWRWLIKSLVLWAIILQEKLCIVKYSVYLDMLNLLQIPVWYQFDLVAVQHRNLLHF